MKDTGQAHQNPDQAIDIDFLRTWIGKEQRRSDYVCPSGATRISALLDRSDGLFRPGQAIPAAWYVMLFTATEPQSQLGRDGHPRIGGFFPPVPLPKRMFAGRRITFHSDLVIGTEVLRESTISDVKLKQGKNGEMCFVTVRHQLFVDTTLLLTEEQDVVYRGEAIPSETSAKSGEASATSSAAWAKKKAAMPVELPAAQFQKTLFIDPTMLFRYSAITFNAHRIHYDLDYARGVENYPGLVVNGGLTTLLLWDFAMLRTGEKIVASRSRNICPLFVNDTVTLNLAIDKASRQGWAWASNAQGETVILIEIQMGQQ